MSCIVATCLATTNVIPLPGMSSDDSGEKPVATHHQYTRLPGSCDYCRKRKSKCDSAKAEDHICTNCRTLSIPCTRDMPTKKRGMKTYYEVTRRVHELERELAKARQMLSASTSGSCARPMLPVPTKNIGQDDPPSDSEHFELLEEVKRLSLNGEEKDRYFGPSSNLSFMRKMMDNSFNGNNTPAIDRQWTKPAWEIDAYRAPLIFPEDDLLEDLINMFFSKRSFCFPVLHQATFRQQVASGLHLFNWSFGANVLLVCAIASKASDDPRVFIHGYDDSKHSAGWKYFSQVEMRPLTQCPTLHDVQFCALYSEYKLGTSSPLSCGTIIGLGLRYCVELGYHRKRPGEKPSIEGQMKKRAFWTLVFMERESCLYYGHPFSIRDEDIDVEYPIDCDEKFYDTGNPETDFKQPIGQPSRFSSFILHIRLSYIIYHALKTLYGIQKSKQNEDLSAPARGICQGEGCHMAMIDHMLNEWFNSIPAHLQWNTSSNHDTNPYFIESAMAYIPYYTVQILLHRPFIHKPSATHLPSLLICTNAARSLSRIVEAFGMRFPVTVFLLNISIFTAGTILIMNMRNRRQNAPGSDPGGQDLEDFYRCIRVLQISAERFSLCGRLVQTLQFLADLPSDSGGTNSSNGNPHASWSMASSGYIKTTPDVSVLDPTLFGLMPASSSSHMEIPQVDMSLFQDEDIEMWTRAIDSASLPELSSTDISWQQWQEWTDVTSATYI